MTQFLEGEDSEGSEKIAISLPRQLYKLIERMRKEFHLSRSAMISRMIQEWAKKKEEEKLVRSYVEGYRTIPETLLEIQLHGKIAAESLGQEEWKE